MSSPPFSKARILAAIPVRLESVRLPNKPLASIAGLPLVQWVWKHAQLCNCFQKVVIATDSEKIKAVCEDFGAEVIMTSPSARNGSERVYEAAKKLGSHWDFVFNVQGDMPFVQPAVIDQLAKDFIENSSAFEMATIAIPIKEQHEYQTPSCVKVIFDKNSRALYFSRSSIPHYRSDPDPESALAFKHIGLYAFKPQALEQMVQAPASKLELAESLEQLRALEQGIPILIAKISREIAGPNIEVDTAADLEKANEIAKTYLMPAKNQVQ